MRLPKEAHLNIAPGHLPPATIDYSQDAASIIGIFAVDKYGPKFNHPSLYPLFCWQLF